MACLRKASFQAMFLSHKELILVKSCSNLNWKCVKFYDYVNITNDAAYLRPTNGDGAHFEILEPGLFVGVSI